MDSSERGGKGLEVVYKAPDEFMANTIKSLLENEGIDAVIKSHQIAMYDSIAMMMKPEWGEVLVRSENLEEAKALVEGFLSVEEEGKEPRGTE